MVQFIALRKTETEIVMYISGHIQQTANWIQFLINITGGMLDTHIIIT